jgi:hypothetical protein
MLMSQGSLAVPGRAGVQQASGSLAVLSPLCLLQAARASARNLRLVLRHTESGAVVVTVFRGGNVTMVFSPGDGRSVGELLLNAGLLERERVEALLRQRVGAGPSLQRFLLERTSLSYVDVQRFLDFQARQRLLDALVWEDGYFQMAEYEGGEEVGFDLALPSFESLYWRAAARRADLPRYLEALPGAPARTLVRRRRGALRPLDAWEREVFATIERPVLLPQLVARLLVDDDLVLGAVLRMAERRQLVLEPVAQVAPAPTPIVPCELKALMREVGGVLRPGSGGKPADIWVLVLSAQTQTAPRLVAAMAGGPSVTWGSESGGSPAGVARGLVAVEGGGRLCFLAARPDALSRGALEGILGRCDAVALVREGDGAEERQQLGQLRERVLLAAGGWRPVLLGIDIGAALREWDHFPDAVIGLPELALLPPGKLVESFLGGLVAAAKSRAQLAS